MLTYEAPKQSPPALKDEENGDSNIQVGAEMGMERLVAWSLFTPSASWGARRVGSRLGTEAVKGLAAGCV